MTEKKVRELLAVYDYIKSFDVEKITCEGLRLAMLEEEIDSWDDGFRTHRVTVNHVLNNPSGYTLKVLKETKKTLEYFRDLQSKINIADHLKAMRDNEEKGNESDISK